MSFLLDLLLPTTCLFCEELGSRVCTKCDVEIGSDPRLVVRGGLIGFSAMSYNSSARLLLRSYKELGESELASTLAKSMLPLLGCFQNSPELLVPIPSNKSSLRERGFNPAELIAREISVRVSGIRWQNLLARVRETSDQTKLSPTKRRANQVGSMISKVGGGNVILVDDVVTTGSSLLEAKKTLENAGFFVEGFLTFAETESKGCNLSTQAQSPEDGGTSWN